MTQVSSTGGLGFAVRSNERAYFSYEAGVTAANLGAFYGDLTNHLLTVGSEIDNTPITRAVMRTVIGTSALRELVQHPGISRYIEAATPLPAGSEGVEEHLVYFSRNAANRSLDGASQEDFLGRVNKARETSMGINEPKELRPGYSLTDRVHDPERLFELWGETFGWEREGCADFAKKIQQESEVEPSQRSVWFKGMEDADGVLQACAMAERLNIPTTTGQLALVEHTEWATHPDARGGGLGQQVVRDLSADVKRDLAKVRHLLFAECNLTSGAHIVAARSGFSVPQVETLDGRVGQVLYQNVRVADGHPPEDGYRNFMFTVVE